MNWDSLGVKTQTLINIRNNFNIRKGNPNLRPEYSDSYELAAIYNITGLSINISFYKLNTKDEITYITTLQNNISETAPENLGTNNDYWFAFIGFPFFSRLMAHRQRSCKGRPVYDLWML